MKRFFALMLALIFIFLIPVSVASAETPQSETAEQNAAAVEKNAAVTVLAVIAFLIIAGGITAAALFK